jgi:hypothetical protein
MSDELKKALEAREQEIRRGLKGAEAEREQLMARVRQLDKLIERARIALGDEPVPSDRPTLSARGGERPPSTRTLHDALAKVLLERMNNPLTARELTDEVNARALYRKKDGSPVEVNQVHARVNNYPTLFKKTDKRICLHPNRFKELSREKASE